MENDEAKVKINPYYLDKINYGDWINDVPKLR